MKSNLLEHFRNIKDPRIDRKKQHYLQDILSLVVIGIICGADSWDAIEEFGNAKKEFYWREEESQKAPKDVNIWQCFFWVFIVTRLS